MSGSPSAAIVGERYLFRDGRIGTVERVDTATSYVRFLGRRCWCGYGLWLCNIAERI